LTQRDAIEHALRMAVRGVDHDHVDAGLNQRGIDARLGVAAGADRGADPQALLGVLAAAFGLSRAFWMSFTVIMPRSWNCFVDHHDLLDAVLVQQRAPRRRWRPRAP
jgi:hypothetical protein